MDVVDYSHQKSSTLTDYSTHNTPASREPAIEEKITGKEAVIRSLLAEGVDTIFGYPGGAIMPVYDALYDYQEELKHIFSRHEQGAIHAAQGYARVSGKVGVCLATSGPGATNLITGIADAQIDSTPIVCITGQVASHLLGTNAFQETDIISISKVITKWNVQVTKAEDIPAAIAKAFTKARSGRPGPVLVDITKDAQFGSLHFAYPSCGDQVPPRPTTDIDISSIEEAAQLINEAKRPLVLFGQGVLLAGAQQEFQAFIEKGGLPAAWTIMGLSALSSEHPLNMGMLGMHGNLGPNKLTNACDVLIAVGMRFDDRVTGDVSRYAKQAKVIHLEIDPRKINKIVETEVAVLGDCKQSLALLTDRIEKRDHAAWLTRFKDYEKEEYQEVIRKEMLPPANSPITMAEVIQEVSERTDGQAILVTDVGQHQMVAQRYYQFKTWKSNITSGGLGTMGFALPAALGAKVACPNRTVIAVIGDGGFQMNIQELATLFQFQIGVKILLLNNQFLGMVRQWQELFFDRRYSFTEMINPDFQAIVKGYQIPARVVEDRFDLKTAIAWWLETEGSCFLEIRVGQEDNVFPMIPTGAAVDEIRLK